MGFDQQHLNWLITFLFNTSPDSIEQQDYHLAHYYLDKRDIAENYQLFSMVLARLPQRAKLFFLEESYYIQITNYTGVQIRMIWAFSTI